MPTRSARGHSLSRLLLLGGQLAALAVLTVLLLRSRWGRLGSEPAQPCAPRRLDDLAATLSLDGAHWRLVYDCGHTLIWPRRARLVYGPAEAECDARTYYAACWRCQPKTAPQHLSWPGLDL